MAKRYPEGEFLRKIRRGLMSDGLERTVARIERRTTGRNTATSPTLIEIRTTLADGVVLVQHHNAGLPGTRDDVERICAEHRERPGLTTTEIADLVAATGPAVDPACTPLVVRQSSDMPLMVLVDATLHDIAGRPHPRTLSIPSGQVPGWWRRFDDVQTLELGLDRGRRTASGKPKPLMVDGGLAETLRHLPDGARRLRDIVGALEQGVDQGGRVDEHTPITIDTVNMTVGGIPVSGGPRGIRIKEMAVGGATLTGTTLTVPRRLPETLTLAVAGRRLGEIVDPAPMHADIVVRSARTLAAATALRLDLRGVPMDRLLEELDADRGKRPGALDTDTGRDG